jgi:hypothetical protein
VIRFHSDCPFGLSNSVLFLPLPGLIKWRNRGFIDLRTSLMMRCEWVAVTLLFFFCLMEQLKQSTIRKLGQYCYDAGWLERIHQGQKRANIVAFKDVILRSSPLYNGTERWSLKSSSPWGMNRARKGIRRAILLRVAKVSERYSAKWSHALGQNRPLNFDSLWCLQSTMWTPKSTRFRTIWKVLLISGNL